jgi:plasmid stabilization system protein ParE
MRKEAAQARARLFQLTPQRDPFHLLTHAQVLSGLGQAAGSRAGPAARADAVCEYVIVYCVNGNEVLILRVVHGKRDLEALFDR